MNPKRPRPIRSKTHRLWLGSLACAVPGCMQRPEPHHVRMGFLTLARKPGDDMAIPLCREHHDEVHHGATSFEAKYKLDLKRIANTLWTMSPANPANAGGLQWR